MVENNECLQIQLGKIVPCRASKEYFENGIYTPCPFSQCISAKILRDRTLLEKIMGENPENFDTDTIIDITFHAVCPGSFNPEKNEHKVYEYSKEHPFIHSPAWDQTAFEKS